MEGTPFSSMEEQPTSKPREPATRILAFSLRPKSPSRAEPSVQTMKKSSMKEHHQLLPQAHQILASYTRVENVSNEVKEQAEALILMHKESSTGRERLKRHREEVSGKVMIPETWGQENLLTDWIDYSSFDKLLAPDGITSAREALVAEGRRACTSHQRLRV
ncbi:protein BIC1-like [Populus alba x Populus x berolinensis]|nr:protein BIC1-like [Populus alba x Populus x berolinensis]